MGFEQESTSFLAEERSYFISSITKPTKRSKKTKRLGPVLALRQEQYEAFDVNSTLECIRAFIPLGLMGTQTLLEEEVCTLPCTWHARNSSTLPGRRYGSNPGREQLAGQRQPLRVPRVQHVVGGEIPFQTLARSRGTGQLRAPSPQPISRTLVPFCKYGRTLAIRQRWRIKSRVFIVLLL